MGGLGIRVFAPFLFLALPSIAAAQGALEKFGDGAFGQSRDKYTAEVAGIAEQLRHREIETQQASLTVRTFLFLLRSAKSEQEWTVLSSLRPSFNLSWRYMIETGSLAGQRLQTTSFGKDLPTINEQGKTIIRDPAAAAEFVLGEALVVGPYGRTAGDFFLLLRVDRKLDSSDLERIANAAKSGVIEKIEKMDNKDLVPLSDPMLDCANGLSALGGDILPLLGKMKDPKAWVIAFLSVPGGVSQLSECIRKLAS